MSLLVHLDPGYAVMRAMTSAVVQSSVLVVLFAVIARTTLRRRRRAARSLRSACSCGCV